MHIKKLKEEAVIPTRGSEEAAGYDLYATDAYIITPGSNAFVGTGIAMEIPHGCFGAIFPRSGIACKRGLRLANCVGVIDSDYRGEIIVTLHNDSCTDQFIKPGERIAQMVLVPYCTVGTDVVDDLSDTSRGSGGFGSTGE